MKKSLHEIQKIAKKDFEDIQASINNNTEGLTASINSINYILKDDVVTATCSLQFNDEAKDIVEASIDYQEDEEGIFADCSVDEVTSAVMSALKTPILAAEGDEDEEVEAFDFDAFDDQPEEVDEEVEVEETSEEESEEMEDPESDPDIEVDNNIEGHYIVECDRCHGIFISALVESDQVIDHISGICPLCEKESDQYIKWVVKPVEF